MANFRSIKQNTGQDIKMIDLTQEYLILKMLMRMYDDALKKDDAVKMLEISVDIAESAEKLEQLSCDHANDQK